MANEADARVALPPTFPEGEENFRKYRVWLTLKQMCLDRGYLVTAEEANMDRETFAQLYRDTAWHEMSFTVKKATTNETMIVLLPQEKEIHTDVIKKLFTERMVPGPCYRAIVVARKRVHTTARANIQQMSEMTPPYKVEIFTEAELMFNVTRHKMVPKHEVLTEEEKRILLERYNLAADNLPRMQKEDAIARYFGLDIGQVVRIVRRSVTAGRYVTYRIVHE